jgi:hypothetical protein
VWWWSVQPHRPASSVGRSFTTGNMHVHDLDAYVVPNAGPAEQHTMSHLVFVSLLFCIVERVGVVVVGPTPSACELGGELGPESSGQLPHCTRP